MLFHILESPVLTDKLPFLQYLALTKLLHNVFFSITLQANLAWKPSITSPICFKPRPPSILFLQTLFQLTQCNLASPLWLHRKVLKSLSILLSVPLLTGVEANVCTGILSRTAFSSIIFPENDS
ncbi:hypothetical protein CASFOL_018005 [Castilleja foliolosa]|uniref:Uncharacterized protein n=1 Tax=Castilleja foliolosa TaxID=1961234 RepID=A0ABD3D769_9LAMI